MKDQKPSKQTQSPTPFFKGFLLPLILRVGLPLFVWTLLMHYADQRLVQATQNELASEDGAGAMLWVFGVLSMLTSILGPVFSMMMVFFAVRAPASENLFAYIGKHLSWLFKEQLRAAGKMILWGLLFILPGLWKFFELMLIPFVVCLDPNYQRGEVDALARSRQLFYRVWGRIISLALAFFVFSLVLTSVDEYRSFTERPLTAVFMVLIDLTVFLLFQWVLLRLWEKSAGEQHAHIQLERH